MLLDITFITNEAGRSLKDWFAALLGAATRQFWIGEGDRLVEKLGGPTLSEIAVFGKAIE